MARARRQAWLFALVSLGCGSADSSGLYTTDDGGFPWFRSGDAGTLPFPTGFDASLGEGGAKGDAGEGNDAGGSSDAGGRSDAGGAGAGGAGAGGSGAVGAGAGGAGAGGARAGGTGSDEREPPKCKHDKDCAPHFCDPKRKTCQPKKAKGAQCKNGGECHSGKCKKHHCQ